MASDPVDLATVEEAIIRILTDKPGHRVRTVDVMLALGLRPLRVRRDLAAHKRLLCHCFGPNGIGTTMRDMIVFATHNYAAGLIRRGVKIEAAKQLAGLTHTNSFSRQFRSFFGCLPHEMQPVHLRRQPPACDIHAVEMGDHWKSTS